MTPNQKFFRFMFILVVGGMIFYALINPDYKKVVKSSTAYKIDKVEYVHTKCLVLTNEDFYEEPKGFARNIVTAAPYGLPRD